MIVHLFEQSDIDIDINILFTILITKCFILVEDSGIEPLTS